MTNRIHPKTLIYDENFIMKGTAQKQPRGGDSQMWVWKCPKLPSLSGFEPRHPSAHECVHQPLGTTEFVVQSFYGGFRMQASSVISQAMDELKLQPSSLCKSLG